LESAARLLVTLGAEEPVLVVVEPDDVDGDSRDALVAAFETAINATTLANRLAVAAEDVSGVGIPAGAFRLVLTADADANITVDNVSAGSGIEAVRIDASGGDDAIAIASTNARTSVRIDAGLSDDLMTVGGAADVNAPAVTLRGIRGSALTGPLTVDGQEGLDRLFVTDVGNPASTSGTLNDRTIAGLGMQVDIEYRGVEGVGLQLGQGADSLVVERTIAGRTEVAAGGGADTVTVRNVFGELGVHGEQGADALTLEASAAGSTALLSGTAGTTQSAHDGRRRRGVRRGQRHDRVGTGAGVPPAIASSQVKRRRRSLRRYPARESDQRRSVYRAARGRRVEHRRFGRCGDAAAAARASRPPRLGLRGDAHFSLTIDGAAVNVVVAAEPGTVTAANAVTAVVAGNGQLSADAQLVLVIGGTEVELVVKHDTRNDSIDDLLDDLNAALDFAGIDAARVSAAYDNESGRFSFLSKQGETLEVRVSTMNTAATELGFVDGADAVFDNNSAADLIDDVNAALGRAGAGERVIASIVGDRLALSLRDGTLRVNVAADDPAAAELGLLDGQLLQPHNTATLLVNQATGRAELSGLGMGPLGDGTPGITYDSINRVNIALGFGDDHVNVRGTLNDEPLSGLSLTTIDAGPGHDVILISDTAPAVDPARGHLDGTLDAIDGELIVRAGTGDNVLTISDRRSGRGQDVVLTANRIVGLAPAQSVTRARSRRRQYSRGVV
jgi:hypothetical protein